MCASRAITRRPACLSGEDSDASAIEHWTEREIDVLAFKDVRLDRLGELLKQISDGMGSSIPLACQDW